MPIIVQEADEGERVDFINSENCNYRFSVSIEKGVLMILSWNMAYGVVAINETNPYPNVRTIKQVVHRKDSRQQLRQSKTLDPCK